MTGQKKEVTALVDAALEVESEWQSSGPEGKRAAYERFRGLLNTIADLTGSTYEELFNEAIEEWIRLHFCSAADGESDGAGVFSGVVSG